MEARYAFRKSQWLDECQIAPEIFEQVIPRLYTFMKPFVKTFQGQAADQHAKTYVCGTSNQSRIVLASPACPCKASSAGRRGTMHPCAMC